MRDRGRWTWTCDGCGAEVEVTGDDPVVPRGWTLTALTIARCTPGDAVIYNAGLLDMPGGQEHYDQILRCIQETRETWEEAGEDNSYALSFCPICPPTLPQAEDRHTPAEWAAYRKVLAALGEGPSLREVTP
jgi:hypothetical protein